MDAFYLYGSVYIPRKGGCIPWRSRERARDTGVATVNISRTRTRPSDRRRTACHGLSGSPYRASVSDPPSPRQGLRSRRRRGFSKYSCPLGWSIFFVHCYQIFLFDLVTLFQEFYLEIRLERKKSFTPVARSIIGKSYFLSVERHCQMLIFGNQISRKVIRMLLNIRYWSNIDFRNCINFFFLRIGSLSREWIEICHFECSLIGDPFRFIPGTILRLEK